MTKLEQIEQAIGSLKPEEVSKLADWLAALQADLWDKQIEEDAEAGRLNALAEKALADHRAGLTSPLLLQ